MLVCQLDCIELDILHPEYPKPLSLVKALLSEPPKTSSSEMPTVSRIRDVIIPLETTTDQIDAIRSAIVGDFSDVFDQEEGLGRIIGPEMVIQLREEEEPYCVDGARPIAFGDRMKVKGLLGALVAKGVVVAVS